MLVHNSHDFQIIASLKIQNLQIRSCKQKKIKFRTTEEKELTIDNDAQTLCAMKSNVAESDTGKLKFKDAKFVAVKDL